MSVLAGYFDARATTGQKAGSGGMAFLLFSEGDPWSPDRARAGPRPGTDAPTGGMVAFKDCMVWGSSPAGRSACYYQADLDLDQCLEDTALL